MTDENKNTGAASGLSAAAGYAWRPIDSAPKDGTEIIVGYDFATVWIAHVAFYGTGLLICDDGSEYELWREQGHGTQQEAEGWWSYVENSVSQHKLEGHNAPTHWLPLPEIPSHTTESNHGEADSPKSTTTK